MEFYYRKFKELRKEKRFSSKLFCEKANISRATLWGWENGKRVPSENIVRQLAEILEIPVDALSDLLPLKANTKLSKSTQTAFMLAGGGNLAGKQTLNRLLADINRIGDVLEQTSVVITALLRSNPYICYIKDANLKYIAANKAFLNNLSLDETYNVLGRSDTDFFSSKEAGFNNKQDMDVLVSGKSITNIEYHIPGSRKKKWGIISKHPIFDAQNSVIGIIGLFLDITDHKIAEEHRFVLDISINAMKEGVCVYNLSTGKYIYLNKSCKDIYGISDEILTAKQSVPAIDLTKSIHPEDKEQQIAYLNLREWPRENIFRIIKNNGEVHWIESRHTTIRYNEEDCAAFFCRDISEEKRAKDINEILKDALDESKRAFCIIDLSTQKMVYANKYRETIYGYPLSSFIDMKNKFWLNTCIHPDDREGLIEYEKNCEWPDIRRFRIVRPDGKIRWVEAGKVTTSLKYSGNKCVVFFDSDITEEKEKSELHKLFKETLDLITDGIVLLDIDDFKCVYANEAVINLTGFKLERFYRTKNFWFENCIYPDDLKLILRNGTIIETSINKFRLRQKNSKTVHVQLTSFIRNFENKYYAGFVVKSSSL